MRKLLLFFFITLSLASYSQTFDVPKDYKLVVAADYAPYREDIVKCANWLITTPATQEQAKRIDASKFLMKWVNGCPDVHMILDGRILNFLDKQPEFLTIFIGGWAKHTIEAKNFKSTVAKAKEDTLGMIEGNLAGIEAVISFYTLNKDVLGKNKNIEKYIKLKEKGKLRGFVEGIVNSQK